LVLVPQLEVGKALVTARGMERVRKEAGKEEETELGWALGWVAKLEWAKALA
jgi:hypothetical protein